MPRGVYDRSKLEQPSGVEISKVVESNGALELEASEPEIQPEPQPEDKPTVEQEVYKLHVQGVGLSMIAAKLGLESSEVFEIVKKLEQKKD